MTFHREREHGSGQGAVTPVQKTVLKKKMPVERLDSSSGWTGQVYVILRACSRAVFCMRGNLLLSLSTCSVRPRPKPKEASSASGSKAG